MHRVLRWTLGVIGGLAAILAAAAAVVFLASSRHLGRNYRLTVPGVPVPTAVAARLAGHHLAVIRGCADCHGSDFGGAKVIDDGAMGKIYGPNLTTGRGGLSPGYSAAAWVTAVRHGIAADGHPLLVMPSKDYAALSDEDVGALVAYIKSLPAVDRSVPPVTPGPVLRTLLALGQVRLSAEVIDHARVQPIAPVTAARTPEYGRYLATTCSGCHNPHFSGGKIAEGPPSWPAAANLTRGPGSAVPGWTEADFIGAMRTGVDRNGRAINPVMPRGLGAMSDLELQALWSYLQTLPAAALGQAPTT